MKRSTFGDIPTYEWVIHAVILVITIFSIQERVEIHEVFEDRIKNIGYFIQTNEGILFFNVFFHVLRLAAGYLLLFWIIPSYLENWKENILKFAIFFAGFVTLEWSMVLLYMNLNKHDQNTFIELDYHPLTSQIIPYFLLFIFALGIYSIRLWFRYYRNLKEEKRILSKTHQLEKSLQSHFLFNSLNQVYSDLLQTGNDNSAEFIAEISALYRHFTDNNSNERIRLDKEMSMLEKYWSIQKKRFLDGDTEIEKKIDLSAKVREGQIVPFILFNYLENAFEHGISRNHQSFIRMEITDQEGFLYFSIRNSRLSDKRDGGRGMKYSRDLLDLFYANQYTLEVIEGKDTFEVKLIIPIGTL